MVSFNNSANDGGMIIDCGTAVEQTEHALTIVDGALHEHETRWPDLTGLECQPPVTRLCLNVLDARIHVTVDESAFHWGMVNFEYK
jgi:hypothetical protein